MTQLFVNGAPVEVDAQDDTPLLWVIRDQLHLTGAKFGCGIGMCGACTVHVNGRAIRSCITPVGAVAGQQVTTIEGLSPDGQHVLQQAWVEAQAPQCGYCQPGQIMQAATLLADFPRSHRCADQRGDGRQPVPVHGLCAHPQGDQAGRRPAAGRAGPDRSRQRGRP